MMDLSWAGGIPKHWKVAPLKSEFYFGKGLSITKANLVENGIPVLSYGQIHSKENSRVCIDDQLLRYIPQSIADVAPDSLAVRNGFIFADTSEDLEGCGNCNYVNRDGIYGGYHTIILKPKNSMETDYRYLAYLFQTDAWRYQLRKELTEVKLFSVSQKALKSTWIIIPPRDEQKDIVAYLNSKCSAIDEAIKRRKKIIEKLEEYRKSKITATVYAGLNSALLNVSGEWCGAIPEKWTLPRIKYLLRERNIRSELGTEEPLSMSQKVGLVPTKELGDIPHEASSFVGAKTVYPEDLVFNKLKAHLGVFSVSKYLGLVSPDYAVYHATQKADAKYLEFVFKTPQCIGEFIKRATGVGQGLTRLYTDQLFDIKCPCPSIEEQHQIAIYLDEMCSKVYEAKIRQHELIKKLEEYRKSIIYNAVTGKIDCREVVK